MIPKTEIYGHKFRVALIIQCSKSKFTYFPHNVLKQKTSIISSEKEESWLGLWLSVNTSTYFKVI